MADNKNLEYKKELMSLSDDDLETMREGAPMNSHIREEVKRRKKLKKDGGLDYKNSPKEK